MKLGDLRREIERYDFFTDDVEIRFRKSPWDTSLRESFDLNWQDGTPTLYLSSPFPLPENNPVLSGGYGIIETSGGCVQNVYKTTGLEHVSLRVIDWDEVVASTKPNDPRWAELEEALGDGRYSEAVRLYNEMT